MNSLPVWIYLLWFLNIGLEALVLFTAIKRNAAPKIRMLRLYPGFCLAADVVALVVRHGFPAGYFSFYWYSQITAAILLVLFSIEVTLALVTEWRKFVFTWAMALSAFLAYTVSTELPATTPAAALELSLKGCLTAGVVLLVIIFTRPHWTPSYRWIVVGLLLSVFAYTGAGLLQMNGSAISLLRLLLPTGALASMGCFALAAFQRS